MNIFTNKIVIVTGGASGIGKAICEGCTDRGAAVVVIADKNYEDARQVASNIMHTGQKVIAVDLDVSKENDVRHLVNTTALEYGQIDYMFNNAGISLCGEFRDIHMKHWHQIFDTNLWGVIHGAKAAYQLMIKQGFGHIINISSLGGLLPEPMATPYVTTKFGIVGFSLALRLEAAALGVKVSVVCPGMVKTKALESAIYIRVDTNKTINEISSLRAMGVKECANKILQGVEKNRAIITDSISSKMLWWAYRINPAILNPLLNKGIMDIRALRVK